MYLGIRAYKKAVNIENFLVSNWSIPLPILVGTLSASLATASYFLASVSMGIQEGAFEGITTTFGLGVCLVLAGVFWAGPLRRLHGWTMADYYGLRFASKGLGSYCGIIMAAGTTLFMAGGVCVAGGYLLSAIMGISFTTAIILYAGIIGIYCIAGAPGYLRRNRHGRHHVCYSGQGGRPRAGSPVQPRTLERDSPVHP